MKVKSRETFWLIRCNVFNKHFPTVFSHALSPSFISQKLTSSFIQCSENSYMYTVPLNVMFTWVINNICGYKRVSAVTIRLISVFIMWLNSEHIRKYDIDIRHTKAYKQTKIAMKTLLVNVSYLGEQVWSGGVSKVGDQRGSDNCNVFSLYPRSFRCSL